MRVPKGSVRAGGWAALGLAAVALTGAFASAPAATAAVSGATPRFTAIRSSLPATTDRQAGAFTAPTMSVEVALAPRNARGLAGELAAVYTKGSGRYHKWLPKGEFDRRYAPDGAERAAVTGYLRKTGLRVTPSGSPFLIRVTGSSAKITAAFHTALRRYVDARGIRYFSNSAAVSLPTPIAGGVTGVIGLTDTVREHSMIARPHGRAHARSVPKPAAPGAAKAASAGCESGYPTDAQFFDLVNNGTGFPFGYGGAPGCSGLTPAQTGSVYGAPRPGPHTRGRNVTAAVFELSAYRPSDISTWAGTFYGPRYTPTLSDVNVDGGPLAPACPAGDTCPASWQGYSGDIEVAADIEMTLAVARDATVLVYNAPNDETGQTELDEYAAIAAQDAADTVSSSWGVCENDLSAGMAQAENIVFEQMALQGQSMFNSSGDTGAFGCIRGDGTVVVNQADPASQPWVTSVGGTSLEGDNPGADPAPGYPARGTETVWNTGNLCGDQAPSAANGGLGGYFWCANTGAGGGGSSQYWGRPFYQRGPGVNSAATSYANGTTACALASAGTPCREVPDVSADADPYTGYGEYCTGGADTPYSVCALYDGWFPIGGTSLSTPLWAAVIADRDGFQRGRTGNINPLVYSWLRAGPGRYLTDITGVGPLQRAATTNGLYPTTPGYDEATGVGSPKMAAIITGSGHGGRGRHAPPPRGHRG
jgi:subtilase family serine protease